MFRRLFVYCHVLCDHLFSRFCQVLLLFLTRLTGEGACETVWINQLQTFAICISGFPEVNTKSNLSI